MGKEIERKFLVKGDFRNAVFKQYRIRQGYLSSVPDRVVRIRTRDDQGFITIKGKSSAQGTTRYEWEKEIPVDEALELLQLCEPGIIDKTRYLIKSDDHLFEVDEFYGENEGLLIAEIELTSADEEFTRPLWLGNEVTTDPRYSNASLAKHPFKLWR